MQIDGATQVVGIFGAPVSHSLSPAMQNAAIAAAGINAVYVPFHVEPTALTEAVAAVRSLGLTGVNVTVPHKEAVISCLDDIDPAAARVGAVNTIVNRMGRLIGHNTDGSGLLRGLRHDLGFDPAGKKVVVLGGGGAARAAIVALAGAAAETIVIVNRSTDKADILAEEFSGTTTGTEFRTAPFVEDALAGELAGTALVVNSTVVGLHGDRFPFPIIERMGDSAVLFDMVYAPQPTPLQQAAEKCGIPFADGRSMLVGQGEEAFALWFGTPPPSGVMRRAVFE